MSNIVRLVNGGRIQVRTGILQGIGPTGPMGPMGPQGQQGDQGPVGNTGPPGAISQFQSAFNTTGAQLIPSGVDTALPLGGVAYDDLLAHSTDTAFTLDETGDYQATGYVRFDLPSGGAAAGGRGVWLWDGTTTLVRSQTPALGDDETFLAFNIAFRVFSPTTFNLYVRHTDVDSLNVGEADLVFTRIGSGPVGPQGPEGPAGPVGPQGPEGPQGDTGSGGVHPTYDDLY